MDPFAQRLAQVAEQTWEGLRREGRLRHGGDPPRLEMPPGFAHMLRAALELERGGARERVLEEHYLRFMPAMRVELWGTSDAAAAPLFAPLRWERMARVSGAMERLRALLGPALEPCLPPAPALAQEAPCYAALFERTLYGRYLPPLCGWLSDLQRLERLQRQPPSLDMEALIERHLGAALIHELSHGARHRAALDPPYLDECIASYLGVLALPESAFPVEGGAAPLFATPWLLQVGQALARVAGLAPLCQAHAGVVAWDQVLPGGLRAAAARLGWEEYLQRRDPHFLSSSLRPEPWLKLLFLAASGADLSTITLDELAATPFAAIPPAAADPGEQPLDEEILDFALRAMCLRSRCEGGAFLVEAAQPPQIRVDLEGCQVTRAADPGDLRGPAYLFPPALARRLRRGGRRAFTIHLRDPRAEVLAEVRARVLAGAPAGAGPGFEVR